VLHPDKKFIFLWDGASYHGSEEVQTYLNQVNQGLDEKDWKVTCGLFARLLNLWLFSGIFFMLLLCLIF
jgi:hypothetical protein